MRRIHRVKMIKEHDKKIDQIDTASTPFLPVTAKKRSQTFTFGPAHSRFFFFVRRGRRNGGGIRRVTNFDTRY